MAQLKNNDLTKESIENRLYRLLRMQNNIDTHAAELGITGPVLSWGQNCYDVFSGAITASTVEAGESKDATIIVREKFAEAKDYYQKAKDILIAYLDQYKPDEILLASYRVDRPTPRKYLDLTEAIDVFEETHNRLVAAGDDRVIAQAIIDELVARGNDFKTELDNAGIEQRESDVAYQEQHTIFNADTEKLRLVLSLACMIWGDDDPKLKDLGFVPSSEVWTPGGGGEQLPTPGPPENLQIEIMPDGKIKFFWDSPLTGVPEYCNFYLEIVDTGMPEPSMGDTPYREEIITNQAIIDSPGPGKTVYGWATAFDDGEEGEACGPESIDIM